jgi:hypothetical protein
MVCSHKVALLVISVFLKQNVLQPAPHSSNAAQHMRSISGSSINENLFKTYGNEQKNIIQYGKIIQSTEVRGRSIMLIKKIIWRGSILLFHTTSKKLSVGNGSECSACVMICIFKVSSVSVHEA